MAAFLQHWTESDGKHRIIAVDVGGRDHCVVVLASMLNGVLTIEDIKKVERPQLSVGRFEKAPPERSRGWYRKHDRSINYRR
jgi:hypothetical protein